MRQVFARGRIRLIHQQTSGHLTELPRCRSAHASSIWLTTRWHRLCEINSARASSCFVRTLSTNQAYNMLSCVARDDFACAWIEFIARRLPDRGLRVIRPLISVCCCRIPLPLEAYITHHPNTMMYIRFASDRILSI